MKSCAEGSKDKRGMASHERPTWYAHQGVDLGGGGSPSRNGMIQNGKVAQAAKTCKAHSIILQYSIMHYTKCLTYYFIINGIFSLPGRREELLVLIHI